MGRKFFVGGNWKMNGDKASIDPIIAFLKEGPLDPNTGKLIKVLIVISWKVIFELNIFADILIQIFNCCFLMKFWCNWTRNDRFCRQIVFIFCRVCADV